ncbi:hypothetical protein [Micromonospora sp. NPDC047527]|uniref:hypothetical protein n=1 Tax=Micromonospora sp. NPDC047527 TaxID=3155144 RepID=UPI0033F55A27
MSTSCSLLHVPVDLAAEPDLDQDLRVRLAFAQQKVHEVVALGRALRDGVGGLPTALPAIPAAWRKDGVRARLDALRPEHLRRGPYAQRAAIQQARLNRPPPTTTGSFPQTTELRQAPGQPGLRPEDRGYPEVEQALTRLVAGAAEIRSTLT